MPQDYYSTTDRGPTSFAEFAVKIVHSSFGFPLCCWDPVSDITAHLDAAAANAKVASQEFAHAAALNMEQATKLKIQAAEQNAIEAYSEISTLRNGLRQAHIKLN